MYILEETIKSSKWQTYNWWLTAAKEKRVLGGRNRDRLGFLKWYLRNVLDLGKEENGALEVEETPKDHEIVKRLS